MGIGGRGIHVLGGGSLTSGDASWGLIGVAFPALASSLHSHIMDRGKFRVRRGVPKELARDRSHDVCPGWDGQWRIGR